MELHRPQCDRCWPSAPVLRHARGTGSQAYFVLDVLVVSVLGGGGGGRGGAGYVWPRAVDVFL